MITHSTGAARGRARRAPQRDDPVRLTAAQAMRARGMTLIQIAATLGVGRSSSVRALAQTPDSLTGSGSPDASARPEQTVLLLPEPADRPAGPAPISAAAPATPHEIRLLGKTAHRGKGGTRSSHPAGRPLPRLPVLRALDHRHEGAVRPR